MSLLLLFLISCSISKKKALLIHSSPSIMEAKMIVNKDTMSIIITNNTKDTLPYSSTLGANGFKIFVTNESNKIIYDNRPRDVNVRVGMLSPGETQNITERGSRKGILLDEFFLYSVRTKISGYYIINLEIEQYNINESVKVYFDFEKALKELD